MRTQRLGDNLHAASRWRAYRQIAANVTFAMGRGRIVAWTTAKVRKRRQNPGGCSRGCNPVVGRMALFDCSFDVFRRYILTRPPVVDESKGRALGATPRADQPLLLWFAIALVLLAGTAFGLVPSSEGAPEPPANLDGLCVPHALMPSPPPPTPSPDHRIQVREASQFRSFGAPYAPSRGFAELRRDEAASAIDERPFLISTDRKV